MSGIGSCVRTNIAGAIARNGNVVSIGSSGASMGVRECIALTKLEHTVRADRRNATVIRRERIDNRDDVRHALRKLCIALGDGG